MCVLCKVGLYVRFMQSRTTHLQQFFSHIQRVPLKSPMTVGYHISVIFHGNQTTQVVAVNRKDISTPESPSHEGSIWLLLGAKPPTNFNPAANELAGCLTSYSTFLLVPFSFYEKISSIEFFYNNHLGMRSQDNSLFRPNPVKIPSWFVPAIRFFESASEQSAVRIIEEEALLESSVFQKVSSLSRLFLCSTAQLKVLQLRAKNMERAMKHISEHNSWTKAVPQFQDGM